MHKRWESIGFSIFITTLIIITFAMVVTALVFGVFISDTVNRMAESQSREINKQIVMNFESYINSVVETADYIKVASFNVDIETGLEYLSGLYALNAGLKKDVVALFLFDTYGRKLIGPDMEINRGIGVAGQAWFQAALAMPEIFHFNAWQDSSLAASRNEPVIPVSRAFDYLEGGQTRRGILLIELNNQLLTDLARKTNLGAGGHLLILAENGQLLYSSEPSPHRDTARSMELAASLYFGRTRATYDDTDMVINVNTLGHTRWRIVTVSNANEARVLLRRIMLIVLLVVAAVVALSAFFSGLISLRLTRPVSQLESAMLKVEAGDFSGSIEVSGQKEIVQLAHSFNSMVEKVRELMELQAGQQREKRKTELRALQNQINPHFLYNTLDSIVWLAEHERNRDVISTVVSLAKFFRIAISKGETFITVEEELAHVRNYLNIQTIRYVNKFGCSIEVEDGIRSRKVMKLILQPLVENAIYHGIGDEDGQITIKAGSEGDFLVFSVTNTGYGISDQKIAEMREIMRGSNDRPSVGIRNVYQRLKLYYGEQADIQVSSVPDESTTVTLLIPPLAETEEPVDAN